MKMISSIMMSVEYRVELELALALTDQKIILLASKDQLLVDLEIKKIPISVKVVLVALL
jgi:hypothetical protein